MELHLNIMLETANSTISRLFVGSTFICYCLEDGFREPKVRGETRIPAGRYELERVRSGRFYEAYKKKYGFPFAIGIKGIPDFDLVRIHAGNKVEDTEGCPLTGLEFTHNIKTDNFEVRKSLDAYARLWRAISHNMAKGTVYINVNRTLPVA